MTEQPAESPRFQFGLRRLLLWVAIEAILLGTLQVLGLNAVGLAVAGSWVAITAVVRVALGPKLAAVLSGLGGVALAVCLWFVLPIDDATVTLLVLVGGGGGMIPFMFVEVASRGVDWVDRTCEAVRRRD